MVNVCFDEEKSLFTLLETLEQLHPAFVEEDYVALFCGCTDAWLATAAQIQHLD